MRAEVVRAFKDLEHDLMLRKEGDTFDAAPARIKELAKKGFVRALEEKPEPQPEIEAPVEEAPAEEAAEDKPDPKKGKGKKKSAKKK